MGTDPKDSLKITILGTRGSVPTEGRDMLEFGGATSCVLFETADQALFLDAGTGIVSSPDIGNKKISILISHPHLDHIVGLPFFPYIMEKGRQIDIYSVKRNGYSTSMQIERVASPPIWPLRLSDYKSDVVCTDITCPYWIGDIRIDGMESNHPGGSMIFRLDHKERSIVYATDYEHTDEKNEELIKLAGGTDLLLYDAQYTEEEYENCKEFGHSTVAEGMKVFEACGARMMRFVHHHPRHTDEMLRKMEEPVRTDRVAFGRQGEVICL